ncbi:MULTISPECIES: N-acetylmuramoyl-L-alanine amidase [unclassified Novosphingobium]|uniref:N-acetylmuramoyl-L-alanine amidase family protein n=1 Tax=unclassified Novosphingobium TaxID=2644732 RepID=UPI0003B547CD|nr:MULTISPECIES: N-acetylmuramoyl-L-alanine amidase [unclassified Novosphingobium]MBB3358565.1 N-acetylmuramoyl-L-alanine amidase [Novosphingobium sp. BK256]MBB3374926.1 N-acetylmuramoyl-L-alanine amidase [Novosphingobium sp. BK280]MBB3379386.1 N-acetylmuramoyl-L-alanine amidase [Novosphingobium sp. BK258]MBB3421080.1 N-acetylmuramoyl-L-alanine amidase [Novosphingobium sp. BK267]MBB3449347.1 N-acetylmuramoyl-L-alanine amidase [Novosphingobium sp. BK352]
MVKPSPELIPQRLVIAALFVVPLLVLAVWARVMLGIGAGGAGRDPAYVVHVALPDGTRPIDLPPVLGPADASRPLVVIDAGHGGHDPGASGEGTLREKQLTLALALALRDALLAQGHVRVALTRSDDRFLALEERSGIAQRLHADLFLSIHADSAPSADAGGATVYTLSDRGSDAVADALARRENSADMVNGVALQGRSSAVNSILVDLSRREMRTRSIHLADLILREGQGAIRFHVDPRREAAFVVLKSLDLPSALMEAGYISNHADAAAMTDKAWRDRFAKAVAGAIAIFLAEQESRPLGA